MDQMKFQRISVGGVQGWNAVSGPFHAPPVVVLATPLAGIGAYRPTCERLSRSHRVYAVGMPGCGRSERLIQPWSLSDYAHWVAELLEKFDLEDVTLIGHSESGGIALLTSLVCPNRISRIVLADSIGVGGPYSFVPVLLGRLSDTFVDEFFLMLRNLSYFVAMFHHFRNYWQQVRQSLDSDLSAVAQAIDVPVLIAWGARDRTLPERCAWLYAQLIAKSTVYVSSQGSHCWVINRADEFAQVVGDWILKLTIKNAEHSISTVM